MKIGTVLNLVSENKNKIPYKKLLGESNGRIIRKKVAKLGFLDTWNNFLTNQQKKKIAQYLETVHNGSEEDLKTLIKQSKMAMEL